MISQYEYMLNMKSQYEYMEKVAAMIMNFYFYYSTDIDEYCGLPMLEILNEF